MCGSCHIRSVLIGVKYRNCRQTLDVYLCFAIWIEQIQSKLLNRLVTNKLDMLSAINITYKLRHYANWMVCKFVNWFSFNNPY